MQRKRNSSERQNIFATLKQPKEQCHKFENIATSPDEFTIVLPTSLISILLIVFKTCLCYEQNVSEDDDNFMVTF